MRNSWNLKFTYSYDSKIVVFDLLVRKDEDGRISTTRFFKKIVGNTILRADSAHPQPLVTSIPYGQYIKLKRNCSSDSEFRKESDLLRSRLLERGYNHRSLKWAFNRVVNRNRLELLFKSKPSKR